MGVLALKEKFGKFQMKTISCLDKENLFIKGGITVIASLAGIGKTVFIGNKGAEWKEQGYEVAHMNFDMDPFPEIDMLNPPTTLSSFDELISIAAGSLNDNDILIIDSLKAAVSFLGLDISSNTEILPVFQKFRELIQKTGCSIIVVHHVFKPKNVKTMAPSFYGARAIEEQCDSGFIFDRDDNNKKTATIVKSRAGLNRDLVVEIDG